MGSRSPSRDRVRKLYIGGLLENVVKDDLMDELSKHGDVADVWIARNPPGFAFVEYLKSADAEKAVRALDGVTICGSRVRVEFARGGRSKRSFGPGFRGSRSAGRGPPRRYESPRRTGRFSPPFDGSRYPYEQLASLYHPDVANAAAAAAAGFPYGMTGYPPMLPFLPPEDIIRSLQHQSRRRSPITRTPSSFPRDRSPGFRRRSRSPLGSASRPRGRSPIMTYDGRIPDRRMEMRGRGSFDNSRSRGPREMRNGYSPPISDLNGRRDDSRIRGGRDDRRRR